MQLPTSILVGSFNLFGWHQGGLIFHLYLTLFPHPSQCDDLTFCDLLWTQQFCFYMNFVCQLNCLVEIQLYFSSSLLTFKLFLFWYCVTTAGIMIWVQSLRPRSGHWPHFLHSQASLGQCLTKINHWAKPFAVCSFVLICTVKEPIQTLFQSKLLLHDLNPCWGPSWVQLEILF